jgi:carbon monoxide dehydrogenase subunit G
MQIERDTLVPGPPERVFALVDDLSRYPAWMDLVHDVQEVTAAGDRRAWEVELRAQVGPFARSKRLRMVRTVHEPSHRAVFERSEIDGRRHSTWILAAQLESDPRGDRHVDSPVARPERGESTLTMTLTYGGNLWTGAVLQRVLDDHVERGAAALRALLTAADTGDAD